jgi:translation initiation factor IF-3
MVAEDGSQLGVMTTQDAMKLADEQGLDLVEVAPQAVPPVCRITRKERDARKARKSKATQELREVRMKTRIGQHDLSAKTRLVKRLLGQGAKVKVSVMFRGREIDHPELGMGLLKNVADVLVDDALLERPPKFEGRFLAMTLAPNPQKEKVVAAAEEVVEESEQEELKVAEA